MSSRYHTNDNGTLAQNSLGLAAMALERAQDQGTGVRAREPFAPAAVGNSSPARVDLSRLPKAALILISDDAPALSQRFAAELGECLGGLGVRIRQARLGLGRNGIPGTDRGSAESLVFSFSFRPSSLAYFAAYLKEQQIQLVHTVGAHAALFARIAAAWSFPRPVLLSQDHTPHALHPRLRWLDRWTHRWCDGHLVPSFAERAKLLQHARIRPEHIRVLPYAVPSAWLQAVDRQQVQTQLGLDPTMSYLLSWIGSQPAGVDFSLELSAELDHAGYRHALLLAFLPSHSPQDPGSFEETRARLGIRGQVLCIEPARQVLAAQAADLMLLPPGDPSSYWHALLAQAAGTPVLCDTSSYDSLSSRLSVDEWLPISDFKPAVWAARAQEFLSRKVRRPNPPRLLVLESLLPDYLYLYSRAARGRWARSRN